MSDEESEERMKRIERMLEAMFNQRPQKGFYTTAEIVGRAEFTVREWCRHGRILAEKRPCGRGRSKEWMISHDELQRYRDEGLLPP